MCRDAVTRRRWSRSRGAMPDQTTNSKAQAANFFLIDTEMHTIVRANVDLSDIARKLKVMRPWERLTLE